MKKPAQEDDYFDRWTRYYSESVRKNLCPYFEWFKLKLTKETKAFCSTLPGKTSETGKTSKTSKTTRQVR